MNRDSNIVVHPAARATPELRLQTAVARAIRGKERKEQVAIYERLIAEATRLG